MNHDGRLEILLVDDDRDLYDYYVILMSKQFGEDVHLDHCGSGAELAEAMSDHDYDIVILDQRLRDGERGLDLVPTIRKSNPRAVILMNSAYGSEMLAADAIRQGVDDYVEGRKEDKSALIAAIERATPVARTNRELQKSLHAMEEERRAIEAECEVRLDSIKRKIGASIKLRQP